MFENFKVIAHMSSPIATTDVIVLDAIISAAKAKEILKEEFYSGKNVCGSKEMIENMLNPILDKKCGVYCTSYGLGDNREFVTSWSKRWDYKHDDIINGFKGRVRVETGSGHFKNYHMPLVIKSFKTVEFYVRGNFKEVKRLLENYIFFLGKKSSQGFGQVRKWEFEKIEDDYSVIKDNKINRHVPIVELNKLDLDIKGAVEIKTIIPPYWREDCREVCVMPNV